MVDNDLAVEYARRFGFSLRTRVAVLSHRYPNVVEPSFISWEGAELTGATTTADLRALLRELDSPSTCRTCGDDLDPDVGLCPACHRDTPYFVTMRSEE